jgi:hypothetical protein
LDKWKSVIWSDETKFNLVGSVTTHWSWKQEEEGIKEWHVRPTVKFGSGGHVMLWGCITAKGLGHYCRIGRNMDARLYVQILEEKLLPTLKQYSYNVEDITFQQDNDPKHTSRLAQEWLERHRINVLKWPSQSPDLNPIKHLWHYLKRRLASHKPRPKNVDELWSLIDAELKQVPVDLCVKLIESMPKRIEKVLEQRGGYTTY